MKRLDQLLPHSGEWVAQHGALPVVGLALDSRVLRPGELFLAYPGEHSDGRDHIAQAVAAGAAAVVAERGVTGDCAVPLIEVEGLRAAVSGIADRFYDSPSATMAVIGVTGTNGKTSVTQLIAQALRLSGRSCGVIGTLGASLDGSVQRGGSLTTPDPIALQRQLAQWRDAGVGHVAMEISSHGLQQGRVSGVHFRGAVFTNLSRDHLDYHGDMASYGAAKARLFETPMLRFAAINSDDAFGRELTARLGSRMRVLDYSLRRAAALFVQQAQFHGHGVDATVIAPCGRLQLHSGLLGDFNLANLLAVVAVLEQLGLERGLIEALVPRLHSIPGRMQRVDVRGDIDVVVDYAHTPDALEQALIALRRHCGGQLWAVFGCGGDRDRGKRPLMGEVAERLADQVLLTSDNPRSEAPQQIVADILAGCRRSPRVELDRALAIERAVREAGAGDCLLVAGKGHEDYQEAEGVKRPFSDLACATEALLRRVAA